MIHGPGQCVIGGGESAPSRCRRLVRLPWSGQPLPECSAYHAAKPMIRDVRWTLVNIGVGSSNAKNITESPGVPAPALLADDWPLWRAASGRRAQSATTLLAHAYCAAWHSWNRVLPPKYPLPALAEVQTGLAEAALR